MENNFMDQALVMPRKNDVVEGIVVSVRQDVLVIDLNTFTEGELSLENYSYDNLSTFKDVVKVGEKISCVIVEMNKNSDETSITLSRLPILKKENDSLLNKIYEEKTPITVEVLRKVNKGFTSRHLGIELFIPEGQIDIKFDQEKNYVGNKINVVLIDKKENSYVASSRVLLLEEFNFNKETEYNNLKVGEEIEGTIVKLESYGALVKFKYNTGLLRISQIAHERVNKVTDVLKENTKITVQIIKKEEGRIDLSRKALLETPYKIYLKDHKVSDVVKGKVIQKLPIGLIVELTKNVTALLHKNEFSWNPNDNSMDYVKVNDEIEAAIISCEASKERIGLSKKVLIDNPWSRITAQVGDLVDVKITEIVADKGVVVDALGVDGFIAKGDLDFGKKQTRIEETFQVNDEFKAVIIDFNPRAWNLKLSSKKHAENIERAEFESYLESQTEKEESISLGDLFKDILK